jgi:uncharacterized protein
MADESTGKKKGSMSVSEAGRKGGQTVRDKYGHSFYEEIGRKGGEAVKAERGTPFYEEIGKKGGHRVRTLIEEGKKAASESARSSEDKTPAPGGEVVPEPAQE